MDVIKELLIKLKHNNIDVAVSQHDLEVHYDGDELDPVFLKEIKENKQLIIEFLNELDGRVAKYAGIPAASPHNSYALSSAQRRLWVLSRFEGSNIAYNVPGAYLFEGTLNISALQYALASLISRHESLRTVFREDGEGEVRQFILPAPVGSHAEAISSLTLYDFRQETVTDAFLSDLIQQAFSAPFDLTTGPLIRAVLIQLTDRRSIFVFVMHHIISDGWSMQILIRELLLSYNACVRGQANTQPPLRIHYKDYATWQQAQLNGPQLSAHRSYWLQQLSGELPMLELPLDHPRGAVKTYNGGMETILLETAITSRLQQYLHSEGCTLFMGLLSLVNTLLYRYTGQQDMIIGSPIAGRDHADLEDQIGFYVNTLALRSRFSGKESFRTLLGHVKQVCLDAYAHQSYPFDALVEELQLEWNPSRSPLFDVMVVLQNIQLDSPGVVDGLDDLEVSAYEPAKKHTSKFDLLFNFNESASGLECSIEYNSDLYESATIRRMCSHLQQLLLSILSDASLPLQESDYLTASEKAMLVHDFNNTAVAYAHDQTVINLFESQVRLTPAATALVFGSDSYSYRELNSLSNRFARLVSDAGVVAGDCVAVLLDRSAWSVISMIGIMKLGAVYVPVDSTLPWPRIHYMLEQSGSKVLVTEDVESPELSGYDNRMRLLFPAACREVNNDSDAGIAIPGSASSFIIYTSGSTGTPKGVEQTHLMLYNLISWDMSRSGLEKGSRHLQFSSFSFDSSIHDVFYVLSTGGELHVINEFLRKDLLGLKDYILAQGITTLSMPYAALKALFGELPAGSLAGHRLREIISTGEQLYINGGLRSFLQQNRAVQLFNFYGPSETHVVTGIRYSYSAGDIPEKAGIGYPIDNTVIYILDSALKLVPIGVEGEIYIGGSNLAKGYKGRSDLTAERFIKDPYRDGGLLYRSGDIGKWDADGGITYMGRIDNQLKINGYRVELGEIECALRSHPDLEEAVVLAVDLGGGEKELVAYVVGNAAVEAPALRNLLAGQLPGYMVPGHYLQLDKLPLTPNGKVDKRALPSVTMAGVSSGTKYVAPRNEVEEMLVEIWQEVLGRETIGVTDNFFTLGGHSLKATRVLMKIYKKFDVMLSFKGLFDHPTIEQVAGEIARANWAGSSGEEIANTEKFTL